MIYFLFPPYILQGLSNDMVFCSHVNAWNELPGVQSTCTHGNQETDALEQFLILINHFDMNWLSGYLLGIRIYSVTLIGLLNDVKNLQALV